MNIFPAGALGSIAGPTPDDDGTLFRNEVNDELLKAAGAISLDAAVSPVALTIATSTLTVFSLITSTVALTAPTVFSLIASTVSFIAIAPVVSLITSTVSFIPIGPRVFIVIVPASVGLDLEAFVVADELVFRIFGATTP